MVTIGILVADRKLALPVVGDALGVVNRLITPTVDLPVPPAPGGKFILRFGGQCLALPVAVGQCILIIDLHNRMVGLRV